MSIERNFGIQIDLSRPVVHRCNATSCGAIKKWHKAGELGNIRRQSWGWVQDKEEERREEGKKPFRYCPDCFPDEIPVSLDLNGFRAFWEEELKISSYSLAQALKEADTWVREEPDANLIATEEAIEYEMRQLNAHLNNRYKGAKSIKEKWQMLGVTRDMFRKFLDQHAALAPKVYELLRKKLVEKGLMEFPFVKGLLSEGGLDPLWLAKSLPTQKESEQEACSRLNAEISRVLAGFGMIPCNGRNHPFFCFCGFGGTRLKVNDSR